MLIAEQLCLRAGSELDQLQDGWSDCITINTPESWALLMRIYGSHLLLTADQLQMAMVVSDSELALMTTGADDQLPERSEAAHGRYV